MPRAVFTRDEAAMLDYANAIAPLGVEAIAMPVTRTMPGDREALRHALRGDHDAIVVASARAALAIVDANIVPSCDVWAVGPATARVFERAGVVAQVSPEGADAIALARAVLARRPRRVLVPRAEDGREDGIALLRAGGVIVDEVVAYRTIAREATDPLITPGLVALREGTAELCAVFAPSQVAALIAIAGPLRELPTLFVAIGRTTAFALVDAGVQPRVASSPTPAGMANAIAEVYPSMR